MTAAKVSKISPIDPTAAEPFYRQIYDRFRGAIARGVRKPGDRIPTARALTKELGLAQGTIETAYSLLAAEGYIEARGQAGTVAPGPSPRMPIATPAPVQWRHRRGWISSRVDFAIPNGLARFGRLSRLGARCGRPMQPFDMVHPSVYGLPALSAEIAAYLQVFARDQLLHAGRRSRIRLWLIATFGHVGRTLSMVAIAFLSRKVSVL